MFKCSGVVCSVSVFPGDVVAVVRNAQSGGAVVHGCIPSIRAFTYACRLVLAIGNAVIS